MQFKTDLGYFYARRLDFTLTYFISVFIKKIGMVARYKKHYISLAAEHNYVKGDFQKLLDYHYLLK